MSVINKISGGINEFKALPAKDKKRRISDMFFNNAMYIIIVIAVIYIAIRVPAFLSVSSIVNIVSLTAAKLPIALGVAGAIVLTGTDISAGRMVGLAACIVASLVQTTSKLFPNGTIFSNMPIGVVIPIALLIVMVACGAIGFVNGFFVAKFKLHPFIVTLSTQLITYGLILMYMMMGTNNGQTLSNLNPTYLDFVRGTLFSVPGPNGSTVAVPRYVLYAAILVVIMWFVWNKTKFGKNMFAVGSNEEAANVSGVNVFMTIVCVFILAGVMYAITGFFEGARIASCSANTGLNYESDAIAACVIGGVSFVGGTGKISGIVLGVFVLRIIFVALNMLGIDPNLQFIIKGGIILAACSLDMRKYLVRK